MRIIIFMKVLFMKTYHSRIIGLIILSISCQFFSGCGEQPNTKLTKVTYGDLIQQVSVSGVVIANRKTIISAPYNSYIKKLYVVVGQTIVEGTPIVSLTQSLRNVEEEPHPLRAPFTGTVVQIFKTAGEYVSVGGNVGVGSPIGNEAIVRIDDLSKLFIEALVPEIEIDKLKEGQEVIIKSLALLNKTYKGVIKNIFLAAREQGEFDKAKVEFKIIIEILDADQRLKPGMSIIADIVTNKRTHILTLRHEYVLRKGVEYFVTTRNGKQKSIQVGLATDEAVEILDGVKAGESIRQIDFMSELQR